jgi:hypothetical protein
MQNVFSSEKPVKILETVDCSQHLYIHKFEGALFPLRAKIIELIHGETTLVCPIGINHIDLTAPGPVTCEHHMTTIGRKAWIFIIRPFSVGSFGTRESFHARAVGVHYEYIEVILILTGKCNFFAIR